MEVLCRLYACGSRAVVKSHDNILSAFACYACLYVICESCLFSCFAESLMQPAHVFYNIDGGVRSVAADSLSGQPLLLAGSESGKSYLFELRSRNRLQEFTAQSPVIGVGFHENGIWLHVRNKSFVLYNLTESSCCQAGVIASRHLGYAGAVAKSCAGHSLVALPSETSTGRACVELFDLREIPNNPLSAQPVLAASCSMSEPSGVSNSAGMIMCLKLFDDVTMPANLPRVVVGLENGSTQAWDLRNLRSVWNLQHFQEPVTAFDCAQRRSKLVVGSAGDKLCIQRLTAVSTENASVPTCLALPSAGVSAIETQRDEKWFIVGGWNGDLRLISAKNLQDLAVLQYHKRSATCIAFLPNESNGFVCGSKDESISLWQLEEKSHA